MNLLKVAALFIAFLLNANIAFGTIWNVGSGRLYTTPSKVSNLVKNFDTIQIDAGVYPMDVCFWKAHHLVIRGINGRAHLKSGGMAAGQKAIWVIQGDSTIIENIEFSECKVPDKNGAGIRLEATHLVVRNCYFHHNEDGILAGDNANSEILIEFSEFAFNGFGDGQSHNLYINHVKSLTFQYNYSHDAIVGHLLKSRAYNNYILYNRLSEEKGDGSYEIDLPNGGNSLVMGNIIQQGTNSQNSAIISYGKEGLTNPTEHNIVLSFNTMVNEKANGTFLQTQNGTNLVLSLNNIYAGGGNALTGTPIQNIEYGSVKNSSIDFFKFLDATKLDYRLSTKSPCLNAAYYTAFSYPQFTPSLQYKHVASNQDRIIEFLYDVGALESKFLNPFVHPIYGTYGKDFILVNYVDWIKQGKQDPFCGSKTYDGHEGTDYVISGFEQMADGVDVVSVDSGIVTSIVDGLFDMETIADTSKHLGNYVCVRHNGNYYSYYGHLKKNSIVVRVGDKIKQGQVIGKVGCSGNCTDPHLHFEFWYDSIQLIDPFKAPCGNYSSFWNKQFMYDTSFQIWKSGLKPSLTNLDSLRFHQYSRLQFHPDSNYYISYWNLEYGIRKGDVSSMQWYNQAGNKVWQFDLNHTDDAWYYYYWSNVDTKTMGICDHCKAKYFVNNILKDEIIFKVGTITNLKELDFDSLIELHHHHLKIKPGVSNMSIFTLDGRLYQSYPKLGEDLEIDLWNPGMYLVHYIYSGISHWKKIYLLD